MQGLLDIDRFGMTYASVKKFKQRERRGDDVRSVHYSITPQCFMCNKPIMNGKPSTCSNCKSVMFCSKECQKNEWKNGKIRGMTPHREQCKTSKIHMERVPAVRSILQQFTWGRVESDGTFSDDFARAYFDVLGGVGFGYWSRSDGLAPHLPNSAATPAVNPMEGVRTGPSDDSYFPGYQLLTSGLPDHSSAWMIDEDLIPVLDFRAGRLPQIASESDITGWASWYRWRGLPMRSPAALLMHYPLSVYQLLVHVLKVAHPTWGQPGSPTKLVVHYIGAEVELNFIPLFAELALLLPHTDIDLIMFGPAVHDIVRKSGRKPNSITHKTYASDRPIYSYDAPASLGSSHISVHLYGDHEYWSPDLLADVGMPLPTAVVSLNAGLLSYPFWVPVIAFTHLENLPFAVTEYTEQSAEVQVSQFPRISAGALSHLGLQLTPAQKRRMDRGQDYRIEMNPFHRPGQRGIGSVRLPNLPNGFTICVVRGDSKAPPPQLEKISRKEDMAVVAVAPRDEPTKVQSDSPGTAPPKENTAVRPGEELISMQPSETAPSDVRIPETDPLPSRIGSVDVLSLVIAGFAGYMSHWSIYGLTAAAGIIATPPIIRRFASRS